MHDGTQGIALIKGFDAQAVLADKGHDANEIVPAFIEVFCTSFSLHLFWRMK